MRILIVEDDNDLREVLYEQLRSDGHNVRSADNGLRAIDVAKKFRPRVVFTDLIVPGMSGFEVCRQLKIQQKEIVVVAYSGMPHKECPGFDEFLLKPVLGEDLRRVLARYA